MLGTILILIFTLLVLPTFSFYYGEPLTMLQQGILLDTSVIVGIVILYCFIVGELTKNTSQVDKLWSIVPIVYAWYIAVAGDLEPRLILMAVLVTIWGARLTYNFGRRGGYSWKFWAGEEDYRWDVLRQKPGFNNRWVWMLFNLFFICFYQQTLIFLFTLPILTGIDAANPQLFWADYLLAVVFVGLVVIEYIADQQQWNFQTEKYRRINAGEELGEYKHGFVRTGLWGLARHPNYAAEQAIWITFYFYSVAATGQWLNWSAVGALLLLILFNRSANFSEEITASKYPEYKDYQKEVPCFVPFTKFG
ncbi:MAG: DUF1295 domain-containing protein [Aureispira sp.]|nr:DUF1295 domain-containing protein [Aureispira sp.]